MVKALQATLDRFSSPAAGRAGGQRDATRRAAANGGGGGAPSRPPRAANRPADRSAAAQPAARQARGGGGQSGRRVGASGDEWECPKCGAFPVWSTRLTCFRCGARRDTRAQPQRVGGGSGTAQGSSAAGGDPTHRVPGSSVAATRASNGASWASIVASTDTKPPCAGTQNSTSTSIEIPGAGKPTGPLGRGPVAQPPGAARVAAVQPATSSSSSSSPPPPPPFHFTLGYDVYFGYGDDGGYGAWFGYLQLAASGLCGADGGAERGFAGC